MVAAAGGVTLSFWPTKISDGTQILERDSVESVLAAIASNEPQMPSWEFESIILLAVSTTSGAVSKVFGENTALRKPSAKRAAPSVFTSLIEFARLIRDSLESAAD